MKPTHSFELETLAAQMASIERALANLMQSPPSVSGKASALVALAKDARLDGRVGAGDVVVSVMLAGGGFSIGVIGAAGVWLGGTDILSTGEMFSIGTLTGCGLGLLRMGIDALAIPLMLSNLMEWGAERWQEWLEHQAELSASKPPKTVERALIVNPQDADDLPAPEIRHIEHADRIIVIKKATANTEPVEWTYGRLWYFIEDCYQSGIWSRAKTIARWRQQFGGGALTQGEHKAVYDFIQETCPPTAKSPGLWGLTGQDSRPTLEAYLTRFRWTPNQPASQPTNQPEENYG